MPHTNIEKLGSGDRIEMDYEYQFSQPNVLQDAMDEDEECNIGDEAEEAPDYYYNFKHPTSNGANIRIGGYERNNRSSTTKSGSSSLGKYKPNEHIVQHVVSTQDEDDNFLNLEWDENLYEEDQLNDDFEEDKEWTQPPSTKNNFPLNSLGSKFIPTATVKLTAEPKDQVQKETVDDTLPDFGYVSNHSEENRLKDNKVILNNGAFRKNKST